MKFTRVVFGVSPSPYILNATIAHHLEQFESTNGVTARKIRESIYVDDVITGARDIEAAFNLYRESKEIFKKGGFNLRKFMSNSKELQSMINTSECVSNVTAVEESYAQTTLGGQHRVSRDEHKVLGVIWNLESDEFVVNVEPVYNEALHMEPTKRNVVSLVSKIYDPLGFISPVVISFKLFFQELCQFKLL